MIINIIEDFFSFLEKNDFKITVNDRILIFKALKFIDITSFEQVKALFSSVLIKDKGKIDKFNSLLELFFKTDDLELEVEDDFDNLGNSENTGILESVLSSYKFKKYDYGSSIKFLVLNDKDRMNRLIRLAVSNIESVNLKNPGNLFNKVKSALSINNLESDIEDFKTELLKNGAKEEEVEVIIDKIVKNLKEFKKKIRNEIKNHTHALEEKRILSISDLEQHKLEDAAKKVIEKLKKKKNKRYKKAFKGKVDIKKTIHKSVSYDLIPLKRIYKKQKYKKRKIVIFADVSDSVKKYTQTVIYFIYSLNKFFREINTFVFTSEVRNVTELFNDVSTYEEVYSVISSIGGNSDYNSSFDMFIENYDNLLDKNTVFIVMGDARNNYSELSVRSFLEIRKKVKELIWLNPESSFLWNTTDSNMEVYKRFTSKVYQIRTLEDIEKFSDDIVFF